MAIGRLLVGLSLGVIRPALLSQQPQEVTVPVGVYDVESGQMGTMEFQLVVK
jgi:hypothetical protein